MVVGSDTTAFSPPHREGTREARANPVLTGAAGDCPEKRAFGPGSGVKATFLSGKMAKRSATRNRSATAGNRVAG